MLRTKSASPPVSLKGCRILALGTALASLRDGPLAGAALEMGAVAQLEQMGPGGCDLVIIDADAFEPGALAAALKAISALKPAPPLLMVGETLPAGLVRNVLRLEA